MPQKLQGPDEPTLRRYGSATMAYIFFCDGIPVLLIYTGLPKPMVTLPTI